MVAEIDLSGIPIADEGDNQNLVDLDQIDLSGIPVVDEAAEPIQVSRVTQQDLVERPTNADIILAKGIWGVSNTISGKPEDNFANVKKVIPGAELRSIPESDGQGGFRDVQAIFVPDPETGQMTPLKEQGGILGDFSVGLGESLRPIVAGVAGTPAAATALIPGGQAPGLAAMALTSQLGALAYDNVMRGLGIQDTRNLLEQTAAAGVEITLDRYVPDVFENIPKVAKELFVDLPKAGIEKTLNFLSKFGLAPENAQIGIAKGIERFKNDVGTRSARDLLRFMEEENVPPTIAHELVATSPEVRALLENVMKRPFGGTLYKQIGEARRRLSRSIFDIPKQTRGRVLTGQQLGEKIQETIPKFYADRQARQSLLRDKLTERVTGEKVFVGDIINDIQTNKNKFSASDLTESKAYNKIVNYLNLRDNYSSRNISPDLKIDLKVTGEDTKQQLARLFKEGKPRDIEEFLVNQGNLSKAEDSVKASIDDLFEIEKIARKASRDNYSKMGGEFDQLGRELETFSKKVSNKIQTFLESGDPKNAKLKKAIDSQWAKDTQLLKDGLGKLKRENITPERVLEVALQESKQGGTRLNAIKKSVGRVDKNIWNDFTTTVLDRMGKGQKDDKFFSVREWNNKYSSLSPEAKKSLFGDIKGLQSRLDKFSEVALIFQERKLNENTSGTGQFNAWTDMLQKVVTTPLKAGAIGAANYITANLLASPKFIQVVTDGLDPKNLKVIGKINGLPRYGYKNKDFVGNQIKRLMNIANTNISLKDDIQRFLEGAQDKVIYRMTGDFLQEENNKAIRNRNNIRPQPKAEMLGVRG